MEWARQSNQDILFMKIDFKKSYCKVEWDFILIILMALGFGPRFVQVVQILLFDDSTSISTNGVLSTPFKLQKFIRQGCHLAPTLYVLAIDALGYLLASQVTKGTIRGIYLLPPE